MPFTLTITPSINAFASNPVLSIYERTYTLSQANNIPFRHATSQSLDYKNNCSPPDFRSHALMPFQSYRILALYK